MRLHTEKPVAVIDAPTPSRRTAMTESAERARQRATRRFLIARLAARAAEDRRPYRELRLLLEHEMQERRIPLGAIPCRNTINELIDRFRAGAVDAADYADAPRSGRPVEPLPDKLQQLIVRAADLGLYATAADYHDAVRLEAERLKIPVPSYPRVKAALRRLGVLRRGVGRHGTKAAKLDLVPHSTVPATVTNKIWTLDEAKLPLWARMWCRRRKRFVSIEVWIVLVQEYAARAIVGWHLVDPSRRIDAKTGRQMRTGYDTADVMAALVNAAVPALAPPSTRPFAGRLCDGLRIDLHPTHGGDPTERRRRYGLSDAEVEGLFERLKGIVEVPRLPGETPDLRGVIEAQIKFVKRRLCAPLVHCHRDVVLPTDRLPKEIPADLSPEQLARAMGRARTRASGKGKRIPRLTLVAPEDLPSIEELREILDRRITWYNFKRRHPHHGTAPANAYFEALPRRCRSGRDLIGALPAATGLVTKNGLVHRQDNRAFRFAVEADGWIAALGTPVTYRADPLLRCLFAEAVGGMSASAGAGKGGLLVLPPLAVRAEQLGPKTVARRQHAMTEMYGEPARKGRQAAFSPGSPAQVPTEAPVEAPAEPPTPTRTDEGGPQTPPVLPEADGPQDMDGPARHRVGYRPPPPHPSHIALPDEASPPWRPEDDDAAMSRAADPLSEAWPEESAHDDLALGDFSSLLPPDGDSDESGSPHDLEAPSDD
jgi:hypothetical protein